MAQPITDQVGFLSEYRSCLRAKIHWIKYAWMRSVWRKNWRRKRRQ